MKKKYLLLLIMLVLIACGTAKPKSFNEILYKETFEFLESALTEKAKSTIESNPFYTSTYTPTSSSTSTETPTPTLFRTATQTPTHTRTKTSTLPVALQAVLNSDCIPLDSKREIGFVKSITDGDTIIVEINGVDYKVRYIGVDSPEPSSGDLGVSASNANMHLVLEKQVILIKDASEKDKYGRLLRYVVVGDTFVNDYLVSIGMAVAVSYPPDTACDITFKKTQSHAKDNNLGMWSPVYLEPGTRSISPTSVNPVICNCSIDYNCRDFSSHSAAQACFEYCGGSKSYNWSGLDRDRDGIACESLP